MVLLWMACGPPLTLSSVNPDASAVASVHLDPPDHGIQIHMGPFEVEPYSERYLCEIVRVPEAAKMKVGALEHLSSPAGHHFNAFALLVDPEGGEQVGDCWDLWAQVPMALSSPVYASQTASFEGSFPEGVAAEMPSEWLLLEYHMLNSTQEVAQAEVFLNAYEAREWEVLANGLYGNNTDIHLEPGDSEVVSATCPIEVEMELFVLASHMHDLGKRFEVLLDGEVVYKTEDWAAPELLMMSEDPLALSPGDELEWRCYYENDTDQVVRYGAESSDEMCMLAGVYFPDQGFQVCR